MANLNSIAHPYATAAFQYASEKQQLNAWRDFLNNAATIASDREVAALLHNPEISTEKLLNVFLDVLKVDLNAERKNFLLLLKEKKRLNVLPEIASAFNVAYAALEKTSNVVLVTAVPVEAEFEQKLAQRLSDRLQRKIKIENEIDPAILGGMQIRMGDQVMDLSVYGKLNRLLESFLR